MNECGGCRGLGAHTPRCRTQPGYSWKRLADDAESLGDRIGANDPVAANHAYAIAGRMLAKWREAKADDEISAWDVTLLDGLDDD